MRKRSVSLSGHRTSVALEEPFWSALEAIAERRGVSLSALIAETDAARAAADGVIAPQGLASALRLEVLRDLEERLRAAPTAASGPET